MEHKETHMRSKGNKMVNTRETKRKYTKNNRKQEGDIGKQYGVIWTQHEAIWEH